MPKSMGHVYSKCRPAAKCVSLSAFEYGCTFEFSVNDDLCCTFLPFGACLDKMMNL